MTRILNRPKVTYVVLVVAIVGFFALSAVGNTGDHDTDWTWLGDIGWWAFLVSILALIVYTITLAVRALTHRRDAAA
jgi:peptidoglycan/LPS O-acetylase OafA/YrhL